MKNLDFNTSILLNQSPNMVFEAIKNVPEWWNADMRGKSRELGDEFEVVFGNAHRSVQRLIEVIPDKKISWLVTESKLSFLKEQDEWTGTKIHFDIIANDGKTQLRLTHEGLSQDVECYEVCSSSWALYLQNSIRCLLENGVGRPGFPPEEGC